LIDLIEMGEVFKESWFIFNSYAVDFVNLFMKFC
jgi:hypothetical protein